MSSQTEHSGELWISLGLTDVVLAETPIVMVVPVVVNSVREVRCSELDLTGAEQNNVPQTTI